MASPAQIAASIANAAHSTGPVSTTGKETVSRNALTHGLTSTRLLLPGERQEDFDALLGTVAARFSIHTPEQQTLAFLVAAAEWRLARAWRVHDSFLAFSAITVELNPFADDNSSADILAATLTNSETSRRLSLVLRYIRAAERARKLALDALVSEQKCHNQSERDTPALAEHLQQQPVATPAPLAPPPVLTRAERRALERAQRKAAIRAVRGTASGPSALFGKQNAA